MDEMVAGSIKKSIFFLGGDDDGINKFIDFIMKESINTRKISSDINQSLNDEIEIIGKRVREFLGNEKLEFLIITDSSEEIRNVFMAQEIENALGIPIVRIYFGEGYELPDEYDSIIHSSSKDFDNQLENILQLEGV